MNKIINITKNILLLFLVVISILTIKVKAVSSDTIIDTTRKVSLTITKYEHTNGDEVNSPLKGVEFTIYEIPSEANVVNAIQAENYIKNHSTNSYSKITPESGIITFSNLNIGRYYVVETDAPKSVLTKMESFIIDLPRTKVNGNGWDYDVTVYPKNVTIAGTVTLTNVTEENEALVGTTWKLQKKNNNEAWLDYEDTDILTTGNNGKFTVENLEKGDYRFVPNSVLDGYVLNKLRTVNFKIDLENLDVNVKAISKKPKVEILVKTGSGDYVDELGVSSIDTLKWKATSTITDDIINSNVYTMEIRIPENMSVNMSSLNIFGIDNNEGTTFLTLQACSRSLVNNKIILEFSPGQIINYKSVKAEFTTTFNNSMSNSGEFETLANLQYTKSIDQNGVREGRITTPDSKAIVYTGMVKILKTDKQEIPLNGASFKIATTEENARNGIFVKDINNQDIMVTSDDNGYAIFNGLKYGEYGQRRTEAATSYWIVEIQAPSEQYNLLKNPVEVVVNANNASNIKNIVNTEKLTLPLTGGKLNLISIFVGIAFLVIAMCLKRKSKVKEKINEK